MRILTKTSTVAFRIVLAVALMIGHFAICACPASAAEVSIEPVGETCCSHEQSSESCSCCMDGECAGKATSIPDKVAFSLAPAVDYSMCASLVDNLAAYEMTWPEVASRAKPDSHHTPHFSRPATLLFCVLTQ